MKIFIAENAGACYGVKRALDMAQNILDKDVQATTIGPLIHNPKVVSQLEANGLNVSKSFDDINTDVVMIRSHGVTPQVKDRLESEGFTTIDATCPHVKRAQVGAVELAKQGCRVLVVGEKGHPEVNGLTEYAKSAGAKVDVVGSKDDIPKDLYSPIGVVVQTTQTKENLDEILQTLAKMNIDVILKDTICSATTLRQTSAKNLSQNVDAMIVIGGKNSSNTTRLFEICKKYCSKSFHVEDVEDVSKIDFGDFNTVGITAGASTPSSQIDEIAQYLLDCFPESSIETDTAIS